MPGDPSCSVGLPCPTAGVGVPRGARDLPPALARAPGHTGAVSTQQPWARDDFGGLFGSCIFTFTWAGGQGFPQWGLGLH